MIIRILLFIFVKVLSEERVFFRILFELLCKVEIIDERILIIIFVVLEGLIVS